MNYEVKFKERLFLAFKEHPKLLELMNAVESNSDSVVRDIIEKELDDPKYNINTPITDSGETTVINAVIEQKNRIQDCYNELMEMLTNSIDTTVSENITH